MTTPPSADCPRATSVSIRDDELKSAEVHTLDEVSFCELAPGRYPYKITRSRAGHGASRRMDGVIVVEPLDRSNKHVDRK